MNDQQKSAIAERLAVAEHCLLEGADEYLQVKLACEKFSCFVFVPLHCERFSGFVGSFWFVSVLYLWQEEQE